MLVAGCISELYSTLLPTFHFMENEIILNIEIEALNFVFTMFFYHISIGHFIFFACTWNNHGLSSMQNHTPIQL